MNNLIIINLILSVVIVFFQRRKPETVWTWLLVLYFLPIIGFILYLIIGQDMYKRRMFHTKEIEDELNSAIRKQEDTIYSRKLELNNPAMERFEDLIFYNLEAANAVYSADNEVEIYTDGREKFDALIAEMKKAQSYIHLQYYIIRPDELWQEIEPVLIEKSRQGVEIRILYDGMGSRMKAKDWKRMEAAGIITAEFFPAYLKKLQLRINYRNHRKIVVIDGTTAFVGGFNVGREYLGLDEYFGYWRDTHLKITGSAVLSVHIRFILDWNYAAKDNLFQQDKFFSYDTDGYIGDNAMQIITSGPDSQRQNVRNNYIKMINKARHHVYIQTPYFVPDESVMDAIYIAAMSGVDVRIMIPCKPDHPFIYWATYSYIGELLEAGVKCYTYDNGFLHAKGIMVDGLVSSYGTANMDIRSYKLNFEINAIIYNEKTTGRLEEIFLNDLKQSTQITLHKYGRRGLKIRAKEQFSRLLSPLL